jgi:hypothetical protein
MNKVTLLAIPFLLSIGTFAQIDTADVKMISEYGSKNSEITNLMQFQNIDYFNVKFVGQHLQDKYFLLVCKEVWDGKIKKIDTLFNSKENSHVGKIETDTLSLVTFGTNTNDKLKLFFRLPKVGINRKFDAIVTDDYSLRATGSDIKIKYNKDFTAFAYILPYEADGWKMYCAVAQSGVNIAEWGKKFHIKHYLIFDMKFFD